MTIEKKADQIADASGSETALLSGSDTVAGNTTTTHSLAVGASVTGVINSTSDLDYFSIKLVAGQSYQFALNGSGAGELIDPVLTMYNSQGQQIETDDDGGPTLDSLLHYTADATGTYYLAADGYGTRTGQYTLSASAVATPTPTGDPTDALDWGTTVSNPAVISVYFAGNGESFNYTASATTTSQGWTAYEIQQAMAAFGVFEDVINVTFNQVNNAAAADFVMSLDPNMSGLGRFNPPGETYSGVGMFNPTGQGWNATGGLDQGGYAFITMIHEIGHGMGLAHPHDTGGTSTIMSNVSNPYTDVGQLGLNQGIYTTMSYIDGWQTNPAGQSPSDNFGWQGSMMALDIASLQADYGANTTTAAGTSTYTLLDINAAGTFYQSIWDAGGLDSIAYGGASNATIDLRAATLQYEQGGGGYVSYITGIHGGFTIANGVVIENASGGTGNDIIYGNYTNNILRGLGGNDQLHGGGGADTLLTDNGNDRIYGDGGNDLIFAYDGNDTIYGGTGNDLMNGMGDTDFLYGGSGDDKLWGETSADWLYGGTGNDAVNGGRGEDRLYGEAGNDRIWGMQGNDSMQGGAGDDLMFGGNGNDYMNGNSNTDLVSGEAGNDTIYGGSGNDNLWGGDDNDALYGESEDDKLNGMDGDDYMNGGFGDDTIWGFEGIDYLFGSYGNDILLGGNGNDTLIGSRGNDRLFGQNGTDRFLFGDTWGDDTIYDFQKGVEKIDLSAVSGLSSFSQLTLSTASGFATVEYAGNSILLVGVASGSLDQSDFIL